jgi:hypothetical protein
MSKKEIENFREKYEQLKKDLDPMSLQSRFVKVREAYWKHEESATRFAAALLAVDFSCFDVPEDVGQVITEAREYLKS